MKTAGIFLVNFHEVNLNKSRVGAINLCILRVFYFGEFSSGLNICRQDA